MAWFTNLLHNAYFVWCEMAVVIFLITQVLKLPIKHFTKKISNERTRKIVNSTILLIPFALGVLLEFLYNTYYLHTAFTCITGLGYGMAGVSLYGIIERFFKVKIDNPFDSEEGQAVISLVEGLAKDGKISQDDFEVVQKFIAEIQCGECDEEKKSAAKGLVEEVGKDGEVNENDASAIKEFLDKVKK